MIPALSIPLVNTNPPSPLAALQIAPSTPAALAPLPPAQNETPICLSVRPRSPHSSPFQSGTSRALLSVSSDSSNHSDAKAIATPFLLPPAPLPSILSQLSPSPSPYPLRLSSPFLNPEDVLLALRHRLRPGRLYNPK